jgi:hypothetical protein
MSQFTCRQCRAPIEPPVFAPFRIIKGAAVVYECKMEVGYKCEACETTQTTRFRVKMMADRNELELIELRK